MFKIKSDSRFKTLENIFFILISLGALMVAAGLGFSAFSQGGLTTIAIYGGFLVMVFTIALVLLYVIKDFRVTQ